MQCEKHCSSKGHCHLIHDLQNMLDLLPEGGHPDLKPLVDSSLLKMPWQQQSMFLDVATVLRGQPKWAAMAVWEAWHGANTGYWLDGLKNCCLLGVNAAGNIQMHDVVANLGHGILLDDNWGPGGRHYGSRLWLQQGGVRGRKQVQARVCASRQKPSRLLSTAAAWLTAITIREAHYIV
jgi:hypothetical protein